MILGAVWIVGVLTMIILVTKSVLRLHILKKSALSLQNVEVRKIYYNCLDEMNLKKDIPIYSTAFFKISHHRWHLETMHLFADTFDF